MQGWMAHLSNGETVYETAPIPGEITPWQALIQGLRSGNITITRLTLVRGNTSAISMPPKMCEGYFHAYEEHYSWFKKSKFLSLQGIGSIVGDQVHITWMNLDGTEVRQDIRPLDSCKIHTTLQ